jgi:hypothetical protein
MLPGRVENAPEQLESMPEIAFGNDGMTITAMDSSHRVLWKRRLNTVIASVYGAVGHQWVPLTVLDDKERLEEKSDGRTRQRVGRNKYVPATQSMAYAKTCCCWIREISMCYPNQLSKDCS